jgi:hypothetical protein
VYGENDAHAVDLLYSQEANNLNWEHPIVFLLLNHLIIHRSAINFGPLLYIANCERVVLIRGQ